MEEYKKQIFERHKTYLIIGLVILLAAFVLHLLGFV